MWPADQVAELTRIANMNPVWQAYLNQKYISDCFKPACFNHRCKLLHIKDVGSMFFLWCRAAGMEGLSIIAGEIPSKVAWESDEGSLYITDICFTPEVPPSRAVRAMMECLKDCNIAEKGEKVYFRRTTPGRPERIGWITAR